MHIIKLCCVTAFFVVSACTSYGPVKGQGTVRYNLIQVDLDGSYYELPASEEEKIDSRKAYDRVMVCYARKVDKKDCEDALKEQLAISKKQFKDIIGSIQSFKKWPPGNRPKRIVIYVHGGLNSREGALKRVIEQSALMESEGIYPVFINWRTGAVSSLGDHYFRIRDGQISNRARYTSPIYMIGDFFKTLGFAPMAWYKEAIHSWDSSVHREKTNEKLLTIGENTVACAEGDQSSSYGRTALWWGTSPVKVLTTPVVYSIGQPAWDMMQRRVDTQFVKPTDFKDNGVEHQPGKSSQTASSFNATKITPFLELGQKNQESSDNKKSQAPLKAATAATAMFIEELEKKIGNDASYEITIIGHSMGAMVINRVLENAPNIRLKNIVYMGSADTLESFLYTTVPYVIRAEDAGHKVNVYSLHLHPENEDREVSAYGLAPSGSLLVWIDNAFGNPDYTLQRTAGRWSNMRQVIPLINANAASMVNFKIFCISKHRFADRMPQKHGEFDDTVNRFWDASFWQ